MTNDSLIETPIQARTFDEVCKLPRDNFPASDRVWNLMLQPENNAVLLIQPNAQGETIEIPRDQWDVMVKWYMGIVP